MNGKTLQWFKLYIICPHSLITQKFIHHTFYDFQFTSFSVHPLLSTQLQDHPTRSPLTTNITSIFTPLALVVSHFRPLTIGTPYLPPFVPSNLLDLSNFTSKPTTFSNLLIINIYY